jgi:hypothetical protein
MYGYLRRVFRHTWREVSLVLDEAQVSKSHVTEQLRVTLTLTCPRSRSQKLSVVSLNGGTLHPVDYMFCRGQLDMANSADRSLQVLQ